jgi:hypothetical protein
MQSFDFKIKKINPVAQFHKKIISTKNFTGTFLVFDVSGSVGILERVQGLHKIPVKISRASTHIQKAQ